MGGELRPYSTDRDLAVDVKAWIESKSYRVEISAHAGKHEWFCEIYRQGGTQDHNPDVVITGESEAEVICRAALKLVGSDPA